MADFDELILINETMKYNIPLLKALFVHNSLAFLVSDQNLQIHT